MRARLRSESRIQVDHYIDTRLWLLSYSVYDDPLHNHLLLRRYDLLAMNLSQRFAELNVVNDGEFTDSGNSEISFAFLVRVMHQFRTSLDYLQSKTEHYQRQFQALSNESTITPWTGFGTNIVYLLQASNVQMHTCGRYLSAVQIACAEH